MSREIFILGTIRSGTTIFYNLIAAHPDTCWISTFSDRHAGAAWSVALHRLLDAPVVGAQQRRAIIRNRPTRPRMHWLPWPAEGDRVYHRQCGFGEEPDGVETRLTEAMEARLKAIVSGHLQGTGKSVFVSKQTANNRRVALLDRMFPNARYIHLIRDGRAVASSSVREPWWNDLNIWWLGRKAREWEGEQVELAALNWKRTVEEIRRAGEPLGHRYVEIRYESLTEDPRRVVSDVLGACGLRLPGEFVDMLPPRLPNMNRKWQVNLSDSQKRVVEAAAGDLLQELGYA